MKLKCLHCEYEFDGAISWDELGWHSLCPECGCSFDVDVMNCTCCGKVCFTDKYPEAVFIDERNIICEECSIDYDMDGNKVIVRKDLEDIYDIPLF